MRLPNNALVPVAGIEARIQVVRGRRVMLDADLARLYGVETKVLNKAVKRNAPRFPSDFMFQLSPREAANLRFQFGTSSSYGGRRYSPFVFTQEGIAMLSGILRSQRAVVVNIEIMRAFVRMRSFLALQGEFARRLVELEQKHESHSAAIQEIFLVLKKLMLPPKAPRVPRREIGFHTQMKLAGNPRRAKNHPRPA